MNDVDQDLDRLRTYIDSVLETGASQLPPEPKLADGIGMSRGRLRTLLKRLEAEGTIWRQVGKGTFIGPRLTDGASSAWAEGISMGDVMNARQLIEPQLAAQAAIHAKPSDINALTKSIEEMRAAESLFHWKRLDQRLHRQIAEATHNKILLLLYDTLRSHGRSDLELRLEEVLSHEAAPAKTNAQHEAIASAISSGNPDLAEAAMRIHLLKVREMVFGLR